MRYRFFACKYIHKIFVYCFLYKLYGIVQNGIFLKNWAIWYSKIGQYRKQIMFSCSCVTYVYIVCAPIQMQHYAKVLGVESDRSPKCHPEIAEEGIDFDWGCAKLYYRAQSL